MLGTNTPNDFNSIFFSKESVVKKQLDGLLLREPHIVPNLGQGLTYSPASTMWGDSIVITHV